MTLYVVIESRDPFESRDSRYVAETAAALCHRGYKVTIFLIQNGVFGARKVVHISPLLGLFEAGVTVLADEFSLCERGIRHEELDPRVSQSGIDALVDLLVEENVKAIWH